MGLRICTDRPSCVNKTSMVYCWFLCTGILPSTRVSGRAAGLSFCLASWSREHPHIYLQNQNINIFSFLGQEIASWNENLTAAAVGMPLLHSVNSYNTKRWQQFIHNILLLETLPLPQCNLSFTVSSNEEEMSTQTCSTTIHQHNQTCRICTRILLITMKISSTWAKVPSSKRRGISSST